VGVGWDGCDARLGPQVGASALAPHRERIMERRFVFVFPWFPPKR
jgi:hypothetical protein